MSNRLASETSPYLLQHKDNPVDWFAWGETAFAEARRRGVPIFLSVGYSSCYWCHVMERQVFENAAIAKQMNEAFVNVKVDREERPDVDEHYMVATQILSGQGGWPMSVVLTPEGKPFFAGTYFPPDDLHGRPGFPRIIEAVIDAWQNRREQIDATVTELDRVLAQLAVPRGPEKDLRFDAPTLVDLARTAAVDFDPRHGGFGGAPKFPRQTLLELLLTAQELHAMGADGWRPQLVATLDAMANGGIRDHLGGGFHRYSTDARWLVPHFEIMLYDQAMLAWCYLDAYRQFGIERYADVARGICDFVLRDMKDESGAFYTSIDAEVNAAEGGPYLWTSQEVEEVLGPDRAAIFNRAYGLDQGFNFADPHGPNPDTPDYNVLFLAEPKQESAEGMVQMRAELLEARRKRPQPMTDTKILTGWNGLMIRAFGYAGQVLNEPRYREAGEKAALWLLRHHRNNHGGLLRTSREGTVGHIDAFLEDYASLAQGLLALRQAGGDETWADHAAELTAYVSSRFEDKEHGGFYFADAGTDELYAMSGIRRKVGGDNPLPSGNGTMASVLLTLDHPEPVHRVLEAFAGQIVDHPESMSTLLAAALRYEQAHGTFDVKASADHPVDVDEAVVQVTAARWPAPQRLELTLDIAEGFHVYASAAEGMLPLEVTSPLPSFSHTEMPPSVKGQFTRQLLVGLAFEEAVSGGEVEVSLRYQACDESRCLAPVRTSFTVSPAAS